VHISQVTKFCKVAPNVCGSAVSTSCHVTLLMPRILMLVMDFWKICACVVERMCFDNLAASYR
jgi:hypothetical protein